MKNLGSTQTELLIVLGFKLFHTTPDCSASKLQHILHVAFTKEFKHKIPFQLQHIHMLTDK